MLVMRLTLSIVNAVSPQDFLDLVTDFHLGLIADELIGSSLSPDLVLKCMDELLIGLDGINISHQRLCTKKLGHWWLQSQQLVSLIK